ncbi:MAG: triose-phosphate isomerase [Synechococcales cyanobacterium]
MHKTRAEAVAFLRGLPSALSAQSIPTSRQVVFCVPFTVIQTVVDLVKGELATLPLPLAVGAQNIHWATHGAFTGEISGEMLRELGTQYVIVGHSERRQYFGETDHTVNQRLLAAQQYGFMPILCVGETKAIRDEGKTEAWIFSQLDQDLVGVDLGRMIIAYEPIWAIGTGDTCETLEANRVIGLIRQHVGQDDIVIQYGGSVKASNIDEIMAQPEIDGVLVGGASLDPQEFARIIAFQAP